MSVVLTDYTTPFTTITFYSNGITLTKKSNNKITPVKGSNPVIVRLGRTTQVQMTGRVYSAADFNILNAWGGETVVVVSSSSYLQLPNASKWLIKNLEIKEAKGNLGYYDVKFDLEYYFAGAVI
ncbi:MAG: hypothetical protein WC365_01475 [Candidatus Babeliales bacterium]|jgi:hypothetical protein